MKFKSDLDSPASCLITSDSVLDVIKYWSHGYTLLSLSLSPTSFSSLVKF